MIGFHENCQIRIFNSGIKVWDYKASMEEFYVVEDGLIVHKNLEELTAWHEDGKCLCHKEKYGCLNG